jgi:DNA/RNA-binding domain of Phe-tRNA-synthetase-like protein
MLSITVSDDWKRSHAGAAIGLLELSRVENPKESTDLESRKRELEAQLRSTYHGFARNDFLALPILAAYKRYYRQFKKTYHVQLQIESIVLRQKSLPTVSPLVDSNFLAEMETSVLTAGHDAAMLHEPILIDTSREGEQITQMSGSSKAIHAGDMVMRDAVGISCSIIYGQDNRSPITAATAHVLYVSYGPPDVSIEAMRTQLQRIEENVRLFSPSAILEQSRLISTG